MRKFLLLILFILTIPSLRAQDSTNYQTYNKKGIAMLPEKGDWVIGIDATPFIDYIGNIALISDQPNDAPEFAFTAQRPGQLFGKYYLKDNKALRLGLRLGVTLKTDKDGNPSDSDEIDILKENSLNIGITVGVEKHRSIRGRLRGFYGYELGINKTPYSGSDYYGIQFVTGKVEFEEASVTLVSNNYVESGGNTIGIFARGIVGIEYFIAPNISLSGEFGLGIGYESTSERKFNPDTGPPVVFDSGSTEFSVANTASGALVLFFHF
ncbi:MAG: hypothetical protein GQ564_17270 [Bacteroidales bacterium]|nr:hypothetical protein [Bacteroidales bacterium]